MHLWYPAGAGASVGEGVRPTTCLRRSGYCRQVNLHPHEAPARVTSAAWWFRSTDGEIAVWQFPSPALWVWAFAALLGLLDLPAARAVQVEGIQHGALLVWALDELVRGASPFRRALGAAVLVGQIATLIAR